jgi:alpha-mannosidase
MRLSLLRAPKAPDDTADMGHHHIRYAILPHRGALGPTTVRAAFEFSNPLQLFTSALPPTPTPTSASEPTSEPASTSTHPTAAAAAWQIPFISLTGDANLVLDTIKRGEDDEDVSTSTLPKRAGRSVVIRVYDALGGRGKGVVQTKWDVKAVYRTNLLEDDGEEVVCENGGFAIELGPFQLGSWRIVLA